MADEPDFILSHSQGVKLLAVAILLKYNSIVLSGEREDIFHAKETILDISQEIALQIGV
jgi:hypothetical protein